jgi:hypothetical protein
MCTTVVFPFCITRAAVDLHPKLALAAFGREHPRAVLPGGLVTHVPTVPARQDRDPVAHLIRVESYDLAFHHPTTAGTKSRDKRLRY